MKQCSLWFLALLLSACSDPDKVEYEMYLVNGEAIYAQHCSNCHGLKGEGLRNLYPGLQDSRELAKLPELICLIRNGKAADPNGAYKQAMPPNSGLYDLDIAQLVTYLRKTYTDSLARKVSVDEVKKALENCQ